MGNRGQKRVETGDELPPDKRACSSFEFIKSSSSGLSPQDTETLANSTNLVLEAEKHNSTNLVREAEAEAEANVDSPTKYVLEANRGNNTTNLVPEAKAEAESGNPSNLVPEADLGSNPTNLVPEADVGNNPTNLVAEADADNHINLVPETEVDNPTNLVPEANVGNVNASSSNSESSQSDDDKEEAYGSCDSDEMTDAEQRQDAYQHGRSSEDVAKLREILSSLSKETDESTHLAALTELCELLSFCMDTLLSSSILESLSPVLVKLSRHGMNPDIHLLAVRAMTYLCDVVSESSSYLVRHDAVPALCQRLETIEYLDVAEQCLQALQKISREQPLPCLQSGAVMAVLNYIDFFSTSVQRVALSTVVNICKKLPSECPPSLLEAVPVLCNLLQYEDGQLVENVANCLIKIVERVYQSSDMLDVLCKHGLVHQATHLVELNSRTTLGPPVHTALIGLLARLASGSIAAFRTLFELNISKILKDILSTYESLHGISSHFMVDGDYNQVNALLKLLNVLLPAIDQDQDLQLNIDKKSFLVNQPDLLLKLAMDLLPVLIQAVDSGVSLYVCYGCLSAIFKLVYFSNSDMLLELLKCTNISRFLAGVFTHKDPHVLIKALKIVDCVLQKLKDVFLNSFIKEGITFAIDALVMPEKCTQFMFQKFNNIQLSNDQSQKSGDRNVTICLCCVFDSTQSQSTSASRTCKLEKDTIHNLAKQIRSNYFDTELSNFKEGTTDILHRLKMISATLTDMVNFSKNDDALPCNEEKFKSILHQVMSQLNGSDPVSTFEFLESGIVKSLLHYLSNGQCFDEGINGAFSQLYIVEKRFEILGQFLLTSSDLLDVFSLSALVQKLQSALSFVENFPVILGHNSKPRNTYATVPCRRSTSYPCLRVQFRRGEGESFLSEYTEQVFSVDPFSPLDEIAEYLWPKITATKTEGITSVTSVTQTPSYSPAESSSPECRSPDSVRSQSMSPDLHVMQEDNSNLQPVDSGEHPTLGKTAGDTNMVEVHGVSGVQNLQISSLKEGSSPMIICSDSCNCEDSWSNLLFYMDEQLLDQKLTMYQAILQDQIKAEKAALTSDSLLSKAYTLHYRRVFKHKPGCPQLSHQQVCSNGLEKFGKYRLYVPFFSDIFDSDLSSSVEKSSPTYDVIYLLKILESMNRYRFHLLLRERACSFVEGRIDNLDNSKVVISYIPQNEFVNGRLTEKLEQQMRDPLSVSIGGMPSWCSRLMDSCPFVFSFEARCRYFRLAALGQQQVQPHVPSHNNMRGSNSRQHNGGALPRKKFLVNRNHILESATQMMMANKKIVLEVEYEEEVGTGLGPTLEFYTLVSYEFQKLGLGMWREDHVSVSTKSFQSESFANLVSPFGLFPRPWSSVATISNGIEFAEVIKKYVLLGQVVAKALQDGRILDLPFSKAFYKLLLGQDLSVYDIQSFDPGLGNTLLEFHAIIERQKLLQSFCGDQSASCFRDTRIEDLCLDFSLPGYPDFVTSVTDSKMVNMTNLEEYVSFVVDATIYSGISRQVEAFKLGFNQVFPAKHLQLFTEEELERVLCGERELWNLNELLDHIKFDHGYTASSPPAMNLLSIIREFDREQQEAFLRFVTGAPRLPRGGLASLNPKLTIVRKHSGGWADGDLPSVMTCANYLKLPPYSSKERMKEKLLYAITEGQGSFHLS